MPQCLALWLSVRLDITLSSNHDLRSLPGHSSQTRHHGGKHGLLNHTTSSIGDVLVGMSGRKCVGNIFQGHAFMLDLCSVVGQ
jgi:hypothetical protein